MAGRPPLRGARLAATAALGLTAALSAASLLWAADKGMAWTGAQRAALALAAFALPALWPPGRRALLAALTALPLVALAGLAAGLAAAGHDPHALTDGRLVDPTGYPNATAALLLAPAFGALVIASSPHRHPVVRVLALTSAGPLVAGSLLAQSRGSVWAGCAALALAVLVFPWRLRIVAAAALVGGAVVSALDPLLDVRRAALAGDAGPALDRAGSTLVLLTVGLLLIACAAVALDRRINRSEQRRRARAHKGVVARRLGAVIAIAGLVGVVVAGSPAHWAQERFADLRTPDYERLEKAGTRLGGDLGSFRVDYWRVALRLGTERPLGVGAGNFGAAYLARRHTPKAPLYAHSGWLEPFATLGIAGLLAALAFVLAVAAGCARVMRAGTHEERALRLAAALPLAFLLIHGSGDWTALFPALLVPALGLAAAALAPWPPPDPARAARRGGWPLTAVLLAAAVPAVPLYVSNGLAVHAAKRVHTEPAAALANLDLAQRLDPLGAAAPLTRAAAELELGHPLAARAAYAEAARRDRSRWFPRFMIALIDSRGGRSGRARRELAAAARLNPREPVLRTAARRIAGGAPPDPLTLQRHLLTQPG